MAVKVTMEFTLPEEIDEHRAALDGHAWKRVVERMDAWLRNEVKYNGKLGAATQIAYEAARLELRCFADDSGVRFE